MFGELLVNGKDDVQQELHKKDHFVGTYSKRLNKVLVMSIHKTCFCGDKKKISSLRKHAYSNALKILSPRRGGSNEYPQFMFFEQK